MASVIGLTPRGEPVNEKQYFEPVIRQCKGGSKFNDKKDAEQQQFQFENLDDYWTIGRNPAPARGQWYSLELSTKPADKGMWRDIVRIEAVDGPAAQQSASQSQQDVDELFAGKPEPEQEQRRPPPPVDDVDVRIRKGQAANMAVALIAAQGCDGEAVVEVRLLRDRIFHEVLDVPVAPLHYCYEHEKARKPSPGGTWVHTVALDEYEAFCTKAGLVDGMGQPIEGGE